MDNLREEIVIPEGLDQAVADGMRRVKNIHERRVVRKSIGMAAGVMLSLGGFFAWGCCNPVLASQIPVIGRIFENVEDKMTYSGDYSDKAQVLDATEVGNGTYVYTASDGDYTFTAEEVYCDGEAIYLGLALENKNGLGRMMAYPVYDSDASEAEVKAAFEAAERGEGEVMQEVSLWGLTVQIGDAVITDGDAVLEGTQTSANTFEGVVRISLADEGIDVTDAFDAQIEINRLFYADEDMQESDIEGSWKLSLPVQVDLGQYTAYEINDSVDGFGIAGVAVTASEIRIESILPPLYGSREELLAAKRAFLAEVGEDADQMTDEWVDEQVALAQYGDYGIAVFDQNGNRVEQQQSIESAQGLITSLPVAGREMTELHIYVGEDAIGCAKETDEQSMAERALYHVDVMLNDGF